MSRDDLRALLEKIAATAGDPPEHGLDGVAARRRRRTRHRRGAVATAVALAVLAVAVSPRLGRLGEDDHDVTAAETGARTRRTELPDVVQVNCAPTGIEVPVASIQPQQDGLHLVVQNTLASPTDVWVRSDEWNSGRIRVEAGRIRMLSQPVPPGELTVGCQIGTDEQQRRVDLVDVDGIYEAPELSCGRDERDRRDEPVALAAETASVVKATTTALGQLGIDRDRFEVEPYGGYEDAGYPEHTVDPVVAVVAAGDTVAFAHLSGRTTPGRAVGPPWTGISRLDYCVSFLDDRSPAGDEGEADPLP